MLDPVKLETIITQYKNITLQDNIIGYAITGSNLLGLADQQSDTDLILITKGNWIPSTSNLISFFDTQTNTVIEALTEDVIYLSDLTKDKFYGYMGWTFYLMTRRDPVFIFNIENKIKYEKLLSIIKKYEILWINGMLKGYIEDVKDFLKAIDNVNFSLINRKTSKELYHLCYVYATMNQTLVQVDLIKKLKRHQLDLLLQEDLTYLKEILNSLFTNYQLEEQLEYKLIQSFKNEALQIWR